MPDSLQRVNPVLPDVLEGRVWEGQNQGRKTKKNRGEQRGPGPDAPVDIQDEDDAATPSGLIDVRI
jgi:hypothetical protein